MVGKKRKMNKIKRDDRKTESDVSERRKANIKKKNIQLVPTRKQRKKRKY